MLFPVAKNQGTSSVDLFMESVEDKINQAVLQFTLGGNEANSTALHLTIPSDSVEAWRALAEVCYLKESR